MKIKKILLTLTAVSMIFAGGCGKRNIKRT